MLLVMRVISRQPTEDDLERLARGCQAWMTNEGAISLERCLGLRGSQATWRLARRDLAVARAIKAMGLAGKWTPCARLADEWEHFIAAGPWRAWRDHAGPPTSASDLQIQLFWASRYNRGNSLSAHQVQRIYRHLFNWKCK